jgi:hypothetical protein
MSHIGLQIGGVTNLLGSRALDACFYANSPDCMEGNKEFLMNCVIHCHFPVGAEVYVSQTGP